MKRILKQVGIFVLVFSMLVQSIGINAYATGTTSGNNIHTNISIEEKDSVGTTEIQDGDIDLSDWRQMVLWFEKECNNDFLELAAKDQEWWDSLLPNERKTAEMYAKFITAVDPDPEHYTFETLDEVIEKIERGLAIEEFFDGTRFVYLELSDLYLLKENGYTLDDTAYFMEAQYQPELYQSELYDQYTAYQNGELELEEEVVEKLEILNEISLKMMPMDYYGISTFWEPAVGDNYASMSVSSTGYGAGSNTTFGTHGTIYKLNVGGSNAFCGTYGGSARTGYMYGDFLQTNDRIGWIVQNYASSSSKSFVGAQITIWCLQKGITDRGQVAALISTMVYGSTSQSEVSDIINQGLAALDGSSGKSGTYYTLRGPSGSQVPFLDNPPTWSTYTGGGTGGGEGGGGEIPTPPPAPDPEYDTYSDSITVSYNVQVSKKDIDAGVGLAGCVIEVYENGSKVATLTTGSDGTASWSTSRSDSASAEYCSNYDELDSDGRDEVASRGCYESEDDARDAVEDELDDFADETYTYSAKEITAPYGYYNTDKSATPSKTIAGDETAYLDFSDKEQLAELTIYKEGEVLTGATITSSGVTFKYEVKPLANAVYSVYAADTIKTGYGATVYNRGDLVKSGLTTGADGKVKLGNLHLGKYTVKETKPPHGYILNNAEKSVTFTYAGQDVLIVYDTTEYQNIRQKAQVSFLKQDADTKNPLDGAVYGLYADSDIKDYKGNKIVDKGTLIERVTTPANGKSTFKADIPIDFKYVVKEITAPFGYYNNESPYSFGFNYTNMNEAVVKFNNTFENDRVLGYVDLTKYDVESESDITQGNVEHLDGAVYGIYAAEDIIHSDGATGVIHKKDDLITTATVGESAKQNADGQLVNTNGNRNLKDKAGTLAYDTTPGQLRFGDLELGKYYIKELTPPDGYMLDETVYEVTISYHGQDIKVVERDETASSDANGLTVDDANTSHDIYSGDYVIKQGVQFIKTSDDNYGTNLELIEGAGFSIYLITDLSGVQNGTITPVNGTWGEEDVMTFYDYDFTGEPKAKLYKRSLETWTTGDTKWLKSLGGNLYEVKEMFTDADGYIATPELPFGTYVIVETTTPDDHVSAKPFVVHITQDGGVLYTDATKQTVDKKYSETDDLRYGDRAGTKVKEGRALQKQRVINNAVTETYLRVVKADEEFLVQPGTYISAEEVVRGTVLKEDAKYLVKCLSIDKSKNSLTSLNWKYDADGYLTYYSPVLKGNLGTEDNPFTTSFLKKSGKIVDSYITLPQELPVGTYALIEIGAPDGYVINGSEQKVNDTSAGRVNGYEIVDDVKSGVSFSITNGSVFPDGQMGTNKYALTDSFGNLTVTVLQQNQEQKGIIEIYKHGEQLSVVEEDTQTLLDKLPATPFRDIMKAAESAAKDKVFKYEDAPVEGAQFNIVAAEDIYTQELDKALLSQYGVNVDDYLIHSEGDVVATITTDRHGWGYASGLYIGKYKIVETVAGNGFVLNTTQEEFEITKQNQTVNFDIKASDYKNERQKIQLNVLKKDAEKATLLEGAVYALYAAEDIYTNIEYDSPNNKWIVRDTPEVVITADTLIATGITGADGKYQFDEDLPLGKYYVRELEAPLGYFTATEDVDVDASYAGSKGGQNVAVQLHNVVFENYVTKTVITKLDLTNGKELPGATLEVYEVNVDSNGDIVLDNGEEVLTKVDSWVSKAEGEDVHYFYINDEGYLETLDDATDLPAGKTLITKNGHLIEGLILGREYILKETKPADGYVTAENIRFKLVREEDGSGNVTGIAGIYTHDGTDYVRTTDDTVVMQDDVTKLEISKKDLTNSAELPGATLEIYDEDGNMVHTWVSTDTPHYIEKLPIGKYTLVEKTCPDGYVTAEDVAFEILDTGDIQYAEMFDDVTKINISKKDITNSEELPGATLEIYDEDGNMVHTWVSTDTPHYIEKLPIGKYTLVEKTTPAGYVTSEVVEFEIKDTPDIQYAEMFDDVTKLEISKMDVTTGKELPGAFLEIYDEAGNLVASWTSTDKPHYIEKLPVGKYTLVENTAPDGYMLAENVTFEIKDTGEIHKVQMLDEVKLLQVNKYEKGTTKHVKGATIKIYEIPDKFVEYVTERQRTATEAGFIDTAVDKNFKENTAALDKADLSEYITAVAAEGTEYRALYDTKLTLKYSVPKEDVKKYKSFEMKLPEDIVIPEEIAGKKVSVMDGTYDAFNVEIGTDSIKLEFKDAYISAETKEVYNIFLSFDATILESALRPGGTLAIRLKKGVFLRIPSKEIKEIGSNLTSGDVVAIKLTDKELKATVKTKGEPEIIKGLELGWYVAVETEAPNGYILDSTPHVFRFTNTVSVHELTFYNEKIVVHHEPEEPEEEEPEVPAPESGRVVGKLVLGFKNGWMWNNVRTEDTGEGGSSIILSIEEDKTPTEAIIAGLVAVAAGCGCAAVVLIKKLKKEQEA